jgi:hypothetical protein
MASLRSLLVKIGVDLSQYNTAIDQAKAKQQQIESSFRDAANAMQNWQGTSEGLALRVNTLNQKIGLQRQVVSNLKQSYNEVVTAAGPNNEAAIKLDKQYQSASVTLDKMNRDLGQYKTKLYDVATAEGKTAKEAQKMGGEIKEAGTKSKSAWESIKDFAKNTLLPIASVTGAISLLKQGFQQLWEKITQSAKAADDLMALSAKTGLATKTLQEMKYASIGLDVELDAIQSGLSKTVQAIRTAQTAGNDYIELTDRTKVSIKGTNGELKSSEEIFYDVVDSINALNNETEKETAANKIFGRSYQEIMPLIKAGSGALKEYGQKANEAGAVVDDLSNIALAHLNDRFEEIEQTTTASAAKMVASLGPVAEKYKELQSGLDNLIPSAIYGLPRMAMATAGITKEQIEQMDALSMGAYAAGITVDEFKKKQEALQAYLESQGIPTTKAETQSYILLAQGIDMAAFAAQKISEVEKDLAAKSEAAYDEWDRARKTYYDGLGKETAKFEQQMGGMFGELPKKAKKSGDQLIKEKERAITIAQNFEKNLTSLQGRGMSVEMIQKMRGEGVINYQEIDAIAKMSDAQLQKWLSLQSTQTSLASQSAQTLNEPLMADIRKAAAYYGGALRNEATGTAAAKEKYAIPQAIKDAMAPLPGLFRDAVKDVNFKGTLKATIPVYVNGVETGTDTQQQDFQMGG